MSKFHANARRIARRFVLQSLYQWCIANNDLHDIEQQFTKQHDMSNVDQDYFKELLHNIPLHVTTIDAAFAPFLDRDISELNPIELTVLRMAAYELMHRLDIPYKVVINEAVNLTKKFGSADGYKYVNGVLDKVAGVLRTTEMSLK